MQYLEVNGAVRPLKWPLGVKWLKTQGNQERKPVSRWPVAGPSEH
jgi:hypothetical protein